MRGRYTRLKVPQHPPGTLTHSPFRPYPSRASPATSTYFQCWMNTPCGNNRAYIPTVARLRTVTCRPSRSNSGLRSLSSLPDVKSIQSAMDNIGADSTVDQHYSELWAGCATLSHARDGRRQYTTQVGRSSIASRYVGSRRGRSMRPSEVVARRALPTRALGPRSPAERYHLR